MHHNCASGSIARVATAQPMSSGVRRAVLLGTPRDACPDDRGSDSKRNADAARHFVEIPESDDNGIGAISKSARVSTARVMRR